MKNVFTSTKKLFTRMAFVVLVLPVLMAGLSTEASAAQTLGQLSCTIDQIAKYDGSNWGCSDDGSAAQVAALEAQVAALVAQVAANDASISDNGASIASLESLLTHFSRNGTEITIAGANLNIVSGSGATDGVVNGLGNLVVGYNELRNDINYPDVRTGSHNIVGGIGQSFSSYGGLVAGYWNTISGAYASVSGGYQSTASGLYASVSGGARNEASGGYSSVTGGQYNTALTWATSVSGGVGNKANGLISSVCGGSSNNAYGSYSSISGGFQSTALGDYSSISGGFQNTALGDYSTVSGGLRRSVSGQYDWRAGSLLEDQ